MSPDLEAVLRRSPLTNQQRAELWDAFEGSADQDELAGRLEGLQIPKQVKADLWDMKGAGSAPAPAPAPSAGQRVAGAVDRVLDANEDFGIGIAKGVGSSVVEGIQGVNALPFAINRALGMQDPLEPMLERARPIVEPKGAVQNVGFGVEKAGELAVPMGGAPVRGAVRAAKAAPGAARAVARGVGKVAGSELAAELAGIAFPRAAHAAKVSKSLLARLNHALGRGAREVTEQAVPKVSQATAEAMEAAVRRGAVPLGPRPLPPTGVMPALPAEVGPAAPQIPQAFADATAASAKARNLPMDAAGELAQKVASLKASGLSRGQIAASVRDIFGKQFEGMTPSSARKMVDMILGPAAKRAPKAAAR
ncbi:hypothetical protein [Longimicrobium sp.]|uniref:hypothetical protein n=1 Tax=Longimicrobium sp. TaxID=2029185 RepID=UPI002E379FA2|nr:hypothetical protein [Longimicrobium sp.]HEX6038865.1 hypothetical protein [Longimicrobium sp.]